MFDVDGGWVGGGGQKAFYSSTVVRRHNQALRHLQDICNFLLLPELGNTKKLQVWVGSGVKSLSCQG